MFPIEPSTLGVFIPVVGALVVSPGPDTVLILRNALTSGRLAGLVTVFGVQIGLLGHTALAVFGISISSLERRSCSKWSPWRACTSHGLGSRFPRPRVGTNEYRGPCRCRQPRSATVFYAIRLIPRS